MARRFKVAVAATAALAIGLSGCGSPSSKNDTDKGDTGKLQAQQAATDPNAKGPAAEVAGAKKGGTITIVAQTTPSTLDPTDTYYTDSNEIEKLTFRTPTQYDIRDGQPVLVPDLTDLGTVSADKLTWTFKMTGTFKYEDGTDVKVEDLAYAIKRSFAHDVYPNGPAYQLSYFKDGDKYKGPYADGDNYSGVETQGTDTLIIHLAKPFADLPFYLTFPAFTPIPKAKDTKQDYKNHPLSTGPYMFDQYVPGTSLTLKKNPNWDPNTDPARHQYADAWSFKWGGELVTLQQKVLNSAGDDANSLAYDEVDASLIPQLTGDKANQLVKGESPCLYTFNMDTRKITDINIRKAIAKAYPYDALSKANGNNDYTSEPASTILPPGVPGHTKYTPLPDLAGTGAGDPAGAKKILTDAGKLGFEISWYYDNTKPIPQQISNIRADALTKAGFKVKAIGVATADLRSKVGDYDAPVNTGQAPRGWCSDWPTGSSWLPVLFESKSIAEGQSWGMLQDPALDKKIEDVANLPTDQATGKWAALDQEIMGMYVALPWYYTKMAVVAGTNIGGAVGDATVGMPFFPDMYLKS
ncbi:ABC transporter substrate-binding protein [Paractinoplanes toevensis]|uniref:ABC transporter substrate-binding protein n=1 Tax=Paractinoplanes toevensis TaxID=571911 RepID=A0A919W0U3_9ACTN|nr:ABC transporter substrate-binding protein [Actinoplanes toevensis]GIM91682.1 ABC transporter substrate-binding protein [Actinoplanes toevensis]